MQSPIVDCCATDTLFREADQRLLTSIVPNSNMKVQLPNGELIASIAAGLLHTNNNLAPIPSYIFDDATLNRSLVSLADFCNRGCTATLTATDVTITNPMDADAVILHGNKLPTDKL